MADPVETTIVKTIETALAAISAGDTEGGWEYVRTPHIERAVVWTSQKHLNERYKTVYTLTPVRIDPVELGGKRTRNQMSLILVMAAQALSGQNWANWDERYDVAHVMYHEARTRIICSYLDSGGELLAIKSSAGLSNIEITLDEYGAEIVGMASWQLAFAEILVTYTVTYP